MRQHAATVAAILAAAGALHPARPALAVGVVTMLVALVARRPAVACLAVGLLASGLSQRALDGLEGIEASTVHAEVTLLSDPTPSFRGVRADVRLGRRRVEARATGAAAVALEPRLAGEVVRVRGTVEPLAGARPWLVPRHVAGELTVLRVEGWHEGDLITQLANGLRRSLDSGASSLSDRERSLFTGLVIGDDRRQPADLADDFLGAGLTHLLAVSGENVSLT